MTHWVDLTTEQLYSLKELLERLRQLKDISKKLERHAAIAKQTFNTNNDTER